MTSSVFSSSTSWAHLYQIGMDLRLGRNAVSKHLMAVRERPAVEIHGLKGQAHAKLSITQPPLDVSSRQEKPLHTGPANPICRLRWRIK